MNDAEPVVEGGARDQKIWDRRAVPHPMMVRQIPLQIERLVEHIGRWADDLESVAELRIDCVVVSSRAG